MSFFLDSADFAETGEQRDYALLRRLGCRACPLAKIADNKHPRMEASGAARPLVYLLGEGPGKTEDDEGEQFVGESGQILRAGIPRGYRDKVRFNNCVRTRPPKNRTPTQVELECCRDSVAADIARARPRVIVGLGNVPLEWVSGFTGISVWRGRRMPVRVDTHACWYYPITHPAAILHKEKISSRAAEDERWLFAMDMRRVFDELEALPAAVVHDLSDARSGIETITGHESGDLRRLEDALAWAVAAEVVGIDYETRGLRPYAADARLLSGAVSDGARSVAVAFDHPDAGWDERDKLRVRELWAEFLRRARGVKVAHNLSFELEWTGVEFGADLVRAGKWECTQVRASILDERSRGGRRSEGPLSLAFLTQQYFGMSVKDAFQIDREDLYNTPLELVLRYNCPDARYAVLLWREQGAGLRAQGLGAACELALRRVPTLVLTQMRGVPVSQEVVGELTSKYERKIEKLGREIAALDVVKKYKRAHGEYKPLAPEQALEVFHKMLGRRECEVYDKYSKATKLTVKQPLLEVIDHPLAKLTLELREVFKLYSTYAKPFKTPSPIVYPDGLLHASFNTMFAETGRLSCDSPNLQNIPKRTDAGKEIRRVIVAPLGHVIVAIDYGQIEARVVAMFTRDKRFCAALWERYDIHMEWAERIARDNPDVVGGRKNLSDKAKMKWFRGEVKSLWTFPLIYGASLSSVAGYLKMDESRVKPHYNQFWRELSGVAEWQEAQLSSYKKLGYVECLTGRRRRVGRPKNSSGGLYVPLSTNQILNSGVQGTAAEIVMDAMARISESGISEIHPDINIHDDLTFVRVPAKRVDDFAERVITYMLDVPFDFVNVPITVEMTMGRDWMNMKSAGDFSSDEWFSDDRGSRAR